MEDGNGNGQMTCRGGSRDMTRKSYRCQRLQDAPPPSGSRWIAGALATLALVLPAPTTAIAAHADLIMRGGAIYTLDAVRPWASALVVERGRIVYVGDDAGAQAFQEAGVRVIPLRGRMVLPGFHDAHLHPMTGAMRLLRCRLDNLQTAASIYTAVRACAGSDSARPWLLGDGWSPRAFGAAGPTRAKLDELSPDRPAFLRNEDGYAAWVNSKALAIAGVDVKGPAVAGLGRDPVTGAPTGLLEGESVDFVRSHIPAPTPAEYIEALRRSSAMANRFGVTSMFDADANAVVVAAYRAADLAGQLTVRVVAAQQIDRARGLNRSTR